MKILDDFIDAGLAAQTRSWLLGQPLVYGWKAHSSSAGVFWHRNFVLPGTHKHHYDDGAWRHDLTFAAFLREQSPLAEVARLVQAEFFKGVVPTRVWVNVQSFGDEASLHRDFPQDFAGQARSVIWYPVEKWEPDWGGDLIVLDPEGEIEAAAMVKPNRMVCIDGTKPHSVRPMSRYCNVLRIAVAFACEVGQ